MTAIPVRMPIRDALLVAAQEIGAEQGSSVAILTITDRAGVAVGSFYNHFASKEELFRQAAQKAISDFEDHMIARTERLDDPVELLCANMRLYGRMPDTHPLYARLIVRLSTEMVIREEGYNPLAIVHADKAAAAAGSPDIDTRLGMLCAFASFERLIAMRLLNPAIGPDRVDELAAFVLTWLGISSTAAREYAARPLPGRD